MSKPMPNYAQNHAPKQNLGPVLLADLSTELSLSPGKAHAIDDSVRMPRGQEGKKTLLRMNESHAKSAKISLAFLQKELGFSPKNIMDIGCGGGANLRALHELWPEARLCGFDHSSTALDLSASLNEPLMLKGQLGLVLGDVGCMQMQSKYELITAFETLYFWPDIKKSLRNVYQALASDSAFFLHLDGGKKETLERWSESANLVNKLSCEEILELLAQAGFKDIKSQVQEGGEPFCLLARK